MIIFNSGNPFLIVSYTIVSSTLAAYALIYGFSQDGRSEFVGSISYIQEWLMCSKRNVSYIMANLVEKGLLVKEQYKINGVKFNRYKAVSQKLQTKR